MQNNSPSLEKFEFGDGGEWTIGTTCGAVDVRLHGVIARGVPRGEFIQLNEPHASGGRRRPDPTGRLTALRPALPAVESPHPVALDVELPERSRHPEGFPFAIVATAGVTAAVAAAFFSPIFALLAGISALAVIGRWLSAGFSHRRSCRKREVALGDASVLWAERVAAWADGEAAARRARSLMPAELAERSVGEVSPWWERLDDRLTLTLGIGSPSVAVDVEGSQCLSELGDRLERCVELSDVPITVDLDPGLAVVGDRVETVAAAQWLIASTMARIGPADLGVVLITTADRVTDWDQLKWCPSLAGCVVVDQDREDALTDALDRSRHANSDGERTTLLIIDGAEPTGSGLLARMLSGREPDTSLLWLGTSEAVPAGCRSMLGVSADGRGVLEHFDRCGRMALHWFGCDDVLWRQSMRWLARFDDPETSAESVALPSAAALVDLVDVATLHHRWAAATTRHLRAAIGVDQEGAVEVDLVADGPHVLAAGTTGAGKSELLRTLVVGLASQQPPDIVSFVLVDFKGGGAFDAVAALPHVAAVVTDLEPAEAGRALRGLRAEILDREHRLREMEISDVSDVDRSHPRAFGRMVVIVDEFAALAEELPDFLDGLVDIARRGRSLGVHLILATQRPAGVVTGQIRANTNLRICLRVQDRGDSIDVIDDPAAARLPPIPGRVVVRRGAGRCEQLQVAQVSGEHHGPWVELFQLHRCVDGSASERTAAAALGQIVDGMRAKSPGLDSLIERLVEVAGPVARAAPPWLAMPGHLTFPVDVEVVEHGTEAVIGLLDDPDRRLVRPFCWDSAVDGLLVVGADEHRIAATAATAVAAQLDAKPRPIFILDGARSGAKPLVRLTDLDAVVDLVTVSEPERLARAVDQLERSREPRLVVINEWSSIADVLTEVGGPLGVERLVKLARRAGTAEMAMVVTARSDRDVPQRASGSLGVRLLHRLADPVGYLSYGLRPADLPPLEGGRFVDAGSGLAGIVAEVDEEAVARLAHRVVTAGLTLPEPIRVLGPHVDRSTLPTTESLPDGWRVPVGLGVDLDPHWIVVAPNRPVVVVGHPGGGRTTAVTTIVNGMDGRTCVIDDPEAIDDPEVAERIAKANSEGQSVVLGCTPSYARRFGSAVAELLPRATVVLLNPSRNEAELVRIAIPDLTTEPVGRAVSVDRGRATVVQIAA